MTTESRATIPSYGLIMTLFYTNSHEPLCQASTNSMTLTLNCKEIFLQSFEFYHLNRGQHRAYVLLNALMAKDSSYELLAPKLLDTLL
jgi:hypothetical protein